MSISLIQKNIRPDDAMLSSESHILIVFAEDEFNQLPFFEALKRKLHRTQKSLEDLKKDFVTLETEEGGLVSFLGIESHLSVFKRYTLLRKAVKPLLDEKPEKISVAIFANEQIAPTIAKEAYYVIALNAKALPVRKTSSKNKSSEYLKSITIWGAQSIEDDKAIDALVDGNTLARVLTMTPPNELTPALYRNKVSMLAKEYGWRVKEYDVNELTKIGAGAFLAVSQGSNPQDAAILHISYEPKNVKKHVAVIGKGICFDTGGHNLKPAKYMHGMHEDMNGSAVALGVLLGVTRMQLPVKVDCWLAIAQNHISPSAYKQNDVVTSLIGKTIEVIHTDAEGRMVLADTLTLASREKPDWMIDFATLTGSMVSALGDRYSGILGNSPKLLSDALKASEKAGERVSTFPFDEDYDEELESSIADIKQCTLEGGADHVLATRFLSKFIEHDIPWVHLDLSSYSHKGGLGACASDVNGFGVALTIALINDD
jgi:leucyl aminopeptidase